MNLVYCSYDGYPSHKGAAVHIQRFSQVLARAFGPLDLVTLAMQPAEAQTRPWLQPPQRRELADGIVHHALEVHGPNPIARVLSFRAQLRRWWGTRRARVVHVRSLFEGYPIACHKAAMCDALVYEVNGLPSIELKYHYPSVAEDETLLAKLERQEQRCAEAADLIVTPSSVTAATLCERGADPSRIAVIPNGVDPGLFHYREPCSWQGRRLELIYVGTGTSWQGTHHALETLRLLLRERPTRLTIVGPLRNHQLRDLQERARRAGVQQALRLLEPRPQAELVPLYHQADVALVPLTANDRNLVQGCCPLKLIEAMACGTAVVATRLPVVRALAEHERHALLVKPGSAKALRNGVLRLLNEPGLRQRLVRQAREHVVQRLTWRHAEDTLLRCYEEKLGLSRASTVRSAARSTSA